MPSGMSDEARQRLEAIGRTSPEWQGWLRLLEEALRAAQLAVWMDAVPGPAAERPAEAPLLAGAALTVKPRLARDWVGRLVDLAAASEEPGTASLAGAARAGRLDALTLLEGAICQDAGRLAGLAETAGVEAGALSAITHLAALPLLQACGRSLAGRVPPTWSAGYCPICAAWPTLAEVRGLARARRLRCGRCGADWEFDPMRCPYCGTTDHRRLGSLVPEEGGESRRVDTCQNCRGYLKSLTTLRAWPPDCLPLEDLATVDLDIAALEHGYARPERPGYSLDARLVEWPASRRGLFGQRQ